MWRRQPCVLCQVERLRDGGTIAIWSPRFADSEGSVVQDVMLGGNGLEASRWQVKYLPYGPAELDGPLPDAVQIEEGWDE